MSSFINIYEGVKAYDLTQAGYKSFKDFAEDKDKFISLYNSLSVLIEAKLTDCQNRIERYKYHPVWGKVNTGKQVKVVKELKAKLEKLNERFNYIVTTNNSNHFDKLKRWIKDAEKDLTFVSGLKF